MGARPAARRREGSADKGADSTDSLCVQSPVSTYVKYSELLLLESASLSLGREGPVLD